MAEPRPRGLRRRTATAAAAVLLLAAACGGTGGDDGGAVPRDDPAAAPPDLPAAAIPPHLPSRAVWTAPFSSAPKAVGDAFVGPVASDGGLRFAGVGADGRTRWSAARNPSCTAFAATRGTDGRALVVLLDSDADTARGPLAVRTTAAALDPADGSTEWGPVPVPGTLVGPGLVFAAQSGSVLSADSGPKTALDPATGAVVADEAAGDEILHEHEGALLVHRGGELRGVDTATGEELWRSSGLAVPERFAAAERGPVVGYGPRPVGDSSAVVVLEWRAATGGGHGYTVNDLRTGRLLAEFAGDREPRLVGGPGPAAVVEAAPADGSGGGVLVGLSADSSRPLWTRPAGSPRARPESLADGVLYAASGDAARAYDARSGEPLGTGSWRPPAAAITGGPALLTVPGSGGESFAAVAADG
ncbi:outer membrane protein assembly factor BamB [Murinocardiopsis flavida]|uniref:Outer membrane protein assembly factor BamB n=1 Tax=Murinocardiopsis flavida TaxID=645275 RepID=A0A2P8DTP8_9ACTN|nr:PQQ-binding-like beta-propeller repeat protein [Murinocardiopsis flavida]PSL00585.1 outer membrane protein assembly factor BamB [Murinocardiopsis flavida]